MKLIAQLAQHTLTLLQIGSGGDQAAADLILVLSVGSKRLLRGVECGAQVGELHTRALELSTNPTGQGIAFATLLLGTLTSG